MQNWLICLFFVSLSVSLNASENQDSLKLEKEFREVYSELRSGRLKNDSLRIDAWLKLADISKQKRDYLSAIAYMDTILLKFPKLEFEEKVELRRKRARIFNSVGKKDVMIGELLEILKETLKKQNKKIAIDLHHELGVVFLKMDEHKEAEYHLNENIRLARETGDYRMVASGLMSLGNRFKDEEIIDKAEAAYIESIEISKKYGFKRELAGAYNNYGSLMRIKNNNAEAIRLYHKAVAINKETNNTLWLSFNYNNLGNVYLDENNIPEAIRYFNMSMDLKKKIGEIPSLVLTLKNLSTSYEKLGNISEAFKYQKRYSDLKDSLDKVDRIEQSKELAAQFQAERREAEIKQLSLQDELNKQELAAAADRLEHQNFLSWTFGVGGFLILLVAFFLWRTVRLRQRINKELATKNEQIDRKNKEIIDSINYARRIQNSILPGEKRLTELLGWHGLLYRPKDIVSGDFYICDETRDFLYFGTVDCTGHGVPGAMVSIVASASFNKALHELRIEKPEAILEQLSKDIPKLLDSKQEGINDGMDMALVALNKEKTSMHFAGAFQNCWVFNKKLEGSRNVDLKDVRIFENDDFVLYELKGIRRGIGKSDSLEPFRSVNFEVRKGDKILLSTDGFQDQFGGDGNKKFKIKQLREIMLRHADCRPDAIIDELNKALKGWQGTEEQIDDICVFVVEV